MPAPRTVTLEPYRGTWPPDDPDAGFRRLVAEYSAIDPMPTLEALSRDKGIPVGALAAFVLARYCASGSDALLDMGTDAARIHAYHALAAIVSWLRVPLDDPTWRPGR
jgi:hypothetical protein